MQLKANDTVHISSVKADNLEPGEQFEIDDATGQQLVDRGLATEVKGASPPQNKMEPAPENKAGQAPLSAASFKAEGK